MAERLSSHVNPPVETGITSFVTPLQENFLDQPFSLKSNTPEASVATPVSKPKKWSRATAAGILAFGLGSPALFESSAAADIAKSPAATSTVTPNLEYGGAINATNMAKEVRVAGSDDFSQAEKHVDTIKNRVVRERAEEGVDFQQALRALDVAQWNPSRSGKVENREWGLRVLDERDGVNKVDDRSLRADVAYAIRNADTPQELDTERRSIVDRAATLAEDVQNYYDGKYGTPRDGVIYNLQNDNPLEGNRKMQVADLNLDRIDMYEVREMAEEAMNWKKGERAVFYSSNVFTLKEQERAERLVNNTSRPAFSIAEDGVDAGQTAGALSAAIARPSSSEPQKIVNLIGNKYAGGFYKGARRTRDEAAQSVLEAQWVNMFSTDGDNKRADVYQAKTYAEIARQQGIAEKKREILKSNFNNAVKSLLKMPS